MTPTPNLEGFVGRPRAPDKTLGEKVARRGVGVEILAPVGAGILTPNPPPAHFFVKDPVWSPGAAQQTLRAGGGGHPGSPNEG